MKTVLYLTPSAEPGGAELSLLQILQNLNPKQFKAIVIMPNRGKLYDAIRALPIKIIFLPKWLIEANSIIGVLFASIILAFILWKHRVSVIHANSKFCCRVAIWAGFFSQCKVILHWRDFSLFPDERTYLNKFATTLTIIAVSNAIKQFLITEGVKTSDIQVRYDAILPKFKNNYSAFKHEYLQLFNIINQPFVIAITGRIDSMKGHCYLIEALGKIAELNWILLIAGNYHKVNDPKIEETLTALIELYQLKEKIKFIGYRNDLEKVLSCVDLVIVPSEFDALGMVVLEAMAAGKPVIGSAVGGIVETIDPGVTGYLVEPKNVAELADKINFLYYHRDNCLRMGIEAQKRYACTFFQTNPNASLERLYL